MSTKNKSAQKVKLTSYDDLFGTNEPVKGEKITSVPISLFHTFKDHPFRVVDDAKMQETVESIKHYGVLVPGIVRPHPDNGYEVVAGHRRWRACELAGLEEMPVIIRELDDDAATVIMVDTNILLYALDGLSYAQIAARFGCSKYAVRDSIMAVRKIFKTFFENRLHD